MLNKVFILIAILVVIIGGLIALELWEQRVERQEMLNSSSFDNAFEDAIRVFEESGEIDYWLYQNTKFGYEILYPSILKTTEDIDSGMVVFNHNVPYENEGDCDMMWEVEAYPTLDDFNVSIEIVSPAVMPSYSDGTSTIGVGVGVGVVEGIRAYEGVEGCGDMVYYFPLDQDRTLIIKRATIQALSGISSMWDKEGILNITGIITPEQTKDIFQKMLTSFRFIK